ncbi:MAG: hypothetical protein NAOJABEB_00364 [Steroidobacteraceae bacterium]|nr:hypothetical protein [Steroidobacteraceae bacterium]
MANSDAEISGQITRLLLEWSAGRESALATLMPLVYQELHSMAVRHLRKERSSHTLQSTALVHEAFLRLVDQSRVDWQGRTQFFALASQMMRRILIDHARKHSSRKRGGGMVAVSFDEAAIAPSDNSLVDLEAIDDALQRLEALDAQQGQLVELRFFGGLNIEDTADVLGISPATAKREWVLARAWLQRELGSGGERG